MQIQDAGDAAMMSGISGGTSLGGQYLGTL